MKVVLINRTIDDNFQLEQEPVVNPPLGLCYIASTLINSGFEVKLIDAYASNLTQKGTIEMTKKESPDVIGLSFLSYNIKGMYSLIQGLRAEIPEAKIIVGGPHASAMPAEVLTEFPDIDFVVRGEGENIFLELAKYIELDEESNNIPKNILGISFRKDKNLVHTPSAPLIEDLDSIPFPARELIDRKLYRSILSRYRLTDSLITSRGCPFDCSFCYRISPGYRFRSPQNMFEEILEMVSAGIKNIEILDDNFTTNRKRCFEFIKLVKQENVDVEFRVRSRVNSANKELFKELKSIGCTSISYGIESGDPYILEKMDKKITTEMSEKAIKMTREAGIDTNAYFLFGMPGETPQSIEKTINFAIKLNPTYANFYALTPFPDTKVYKEAINAGMLIGDWSFNSTTPWVKLPWMNSLKDLEYYVNLAYERYYRRSTYYLDFIKRNILHFNINEIKYALKKVHKPIASEDYILTK